MTGVDAPADTTPWDRNSTTADADGTELFTGEAWFDPIEAGIRNRVRGFIEEMLEQELTAALGRNRHDPPLVSGAYGILK